MFTWNCVTSTKKIRMKDLIFPEKINQVIHISIIKKINLKELNTYVLECDSKSQARIFEETIENAFGMNSVTSLTIHFEGRLNNHRINATFNLFR